MTIVGEVFFLADLALVSRDSLFAGAAKQMCGLGMKEQTSTKDVQVSVVLSRSVRPRAQKQSTVRPFFGYYGGKWRDALKHYPNPQFDTIVEPFAGSAGYSLRHYARNVILCEIDPVLAGMWKYLTRVKASEVLAIPNIRGDMTVDDLPICEEAKWLVGFWMNRGVASPRKSPSKWMRDKIRPGSFWGQRVRETIASQVHLIRHWKVHHGTYLECPTPRIATWFVDPPYQRAGRHYKFGSNDIDYKQLAAWCKSRPGQVVVCENAGADWLPFRDIGDVKTTRSQRRSKEVLWVRNAKVADRGDQRLLRTGT